MTTYQDYSTRTIREERGNLSLYLEPSNQSLYVIANGKRITLQHPYADIEPRLANTNLGVNWIHKDTSDIYSAEKEGDTIKVVTRSRLDTKSSAEEIRLNYYHMIYTYDLSGNYLGVELSQSRNHLFFPEKASSDRSRINQLAQRSFSDLELWAINDQILMEEYIATGGGNSINETSTNSNGELEYWAFRKYQSLNTAAPIPSGDGIAGGALYSHTPLIAPIAYTKESADIITNYNPRIDKPIQIDLGSFLGAAGKLKITKKSSLVNKLAKSEADFIYDQQAGYLYYNENGNASGFGDGGVFAILEDKPKVGLGDFNFV